MFTAEGGPGAGALRRVPAGGGGGARATVRQLVTRQGGAAAAGDPTVGALEPVGRIRTRGVGGATLIFLARAGGGAEVQGCQRGGRAGSEGDGDGGGPDDGGGERGHQGAVVLRGEFGQRVALRDHGGERT